MLAGSLLVSLALVGLIQDPSSPKTPRSTSADTVTFRDGKVLLGQVVETADRRGLLVVLARRAWVEANLPDRASGWEKAEGATTKQAEKLRHDRLVAWRRNRPAQAEANDPITPWLDARIAQLAAPGRADAKSPLMVVRVGRNTIRGLDRRPKATERLLRLGWTMGLSDPESMPLDDLKRGLEDRGFAATSEIPVAVDDLLPVPLETEEQWTIRRAATELNNLPGGRFLLFAGQVVPEPRPGEPPPANAALGAITSTLQDLLGEPKEKKNPLQPKFRELAGQGRVGAVVTGMEMSPDMSSTTVITTLWVSPGGNRDWVPEIQRTSNIRPADLPANAGAGLAEDPQVKAALNVVSSLGLGDIPPELKQQSLNMGFATQKALNDARGALASALNDAALPLEMPKTPDPAPKP